MPTPVAILQLNEIKKAIHRSENAYVIISYYSELIGNEFTFRIISPGRLILPVKPSPVKCLISV